MAISTKVTTPSAMPIQELTPQAAWQVFDQAAWHYLQMSGEEFLRHWHAGEFDQDPDRPAVMRVAMLRHLVEQ